MPLSIAVNPSRKRPLAAFMNGVIVTSVLTLSGCSMFDWKPDFQWIYKIDIQQGAVVTKEMADQLRPGLTRDQVRFVMGTPPLQDAFHTDRWDYPYRFQPGRGPVELRRFTVFFQYDRMTRVEGDPLPTEKEFVDSRMRLLGKLPNTNNLPGPSTQPSPGTDATLKGPGGSGTNAAGGQSSNPPPAPATSAPPASTSTDSNGPSIWDRVKGWFGGTPRRRRDHQVGNMPLRLAISGASGRMGRMLLEAISADDTIELVGALTAPASAEVGTSSALLGSTGPHVLVSDEPAQALATAAVLVDFSTPRASMEYARYCASHGIGMVIGTTGLTETDLAELAALAEHVCIVVAPNMSVGVNITFKLVQMAARALSGEFDAEVIETHHRNKVDAPSGTALRLGELIAAERHVALADVAVFDRHSLNGARDKQAIGFSSIRAGDVVGDHTVLFAGDGECIEITHRSSSRMTYAQGSLRAAHFVASRKHGRFDMQDVLGLRDL